MMVASPLLSISQAQVQKSVVVSQNNTISVSTTVSNTIPSGNCSVPGPSMLPIAMPMPSTPRPFGNVGTSFFGGMQSLATAALGLEPPRFSFTFHIFVPPTDLDHFSNSIKNLRNDQVFQH